MTCTTNLNGRVAVVTGASEGLGVAFARALATAGACVVIAARRADRLGAVAEDLHRDLRGGLPVGHVHPVPCDVTKEHDRVALIGSAAERFGAIDLLVNNAGVAWSGPAEHETAADVERVMSTNLFASYRLCQLVAPGMLRRRRGSIVNVSSISALASFDRHGLAGYAASKAGLHGLTRELAAQWGARGVRVNALAPGWFPGGTNGYLRDAEQREWVSRHTALRRPGAPDELAAALLFLASDASSYVTGQVLAVDGGWTVY